jgi:hypothetical protein
VSDAAPLKTLPRFLGIGAQKAGTSWLWKNLAHHPGLHLPEPKEHHYFDRDLGRGVTLAEYAARFASAGDRLPGEITPAYGHLPVERVRYVRQVMPDVRLVLLLRNPVDRAWSQALMNLCQHRNRRYDQVAPAEFYAHFDGAHATARGSYVANLATWESVFPREQLLVDFYERITDDPRGLLTDVLRHVGATVPADWSPFPLAEVVFKGEGVPMPDAYRDHLRRKFRDDIERLYDRFGDPVAAWRVR